MPKLKIAELFAGIGGVTLGLCETDQYVSVFKGNHHFHDHFKEQRVNLVNRRKEFFRLKPDNAIKALEKYEGQYNLEAVS